MKTLIRNICLYTFSLFVLTKYIPGLTVDGGMGTFFMGGIALTLMFLIIKPILTIISFPVNVLTLGVFSIFTNAFILYLLTIFVTQISISTFTYEKMDIFGVIIPTIHFNTFLAYLYTSVLLAIVDSFLKWLMKNK